MHTVTCPVCNEETLEFSVWTEYQGDYPMGGNVTFTEMESQDCDCSISDSQMEKLCEKAREHESDRHDDSYDDDDFDYDEYRFGY